MAETPYNPSSTSWVNPMSTIPVADHPAYRDTDEIFEITVAPGGSFTLPKIESFPAVFTLGSRDTVNGNTNGIGFLCASDFDTAFHNPIGINLTTSAPSGVQTQYAIVNSVFTFTSGNVTNPVTYRLRRLI